MRDPTPCPACGRSSRTIHGRCPECGELKEASPLAGGERPVEPLLGRSGYSVWSFGAPAFLCGLVTLAVILLLLEESLLVVGLVVVGVVVLAGIAAWLSGGGGDSPFGW